VTFVKYFSGPINPISQLLVRTHLDHHRLLKKDICIRNDKCRLIAAKARRSKNEAGLRFYCGFLSVPHFLSQAPADWWWKCNRHWLHMRSSDLKETDWQTDLGSSGCGAVRMLTFNCVANWAVLSGFLLVQSPRAIRPPPQPFDKWQSAVKHGHPCPPDRSWLPLEARDARSSGSIGM